MSINIKISDIKKESLLLVSTLSRINN